LLLAVTAIGTHDVSKWKLLRTPQRLPESVCDECFRTLVTFGRRWLLGDQARWEKWRGVEKMARGGKNGGFLRAGNLSLKTQDPPISSIGRYHTCGLIARNGVIGAKFDGQ